MYIEIKRHQDFDAVLKEIESVGESLSYVCAKEPEKMSGNFKLLQLINSRNVKDIIRISGPGFIIDQLYDYFEG
jgi:hypothetical protein